jgi:hypothetical protein
MQESSAVLDLSDIDKPREIEESPSMREISCAVWERGEH